MSVENPLILLVEDEADAAALLRDYLELHRYHVLWAADGLIARTLIQRHRSTIALAIVDVMVPGLDGYEVLKVLRTEAPGARVMFLTALGQDQDEIRGLQLGADDYVRKPASLSLLLARVQTLLRRLPTGDAALTSGAVGECLSSEGVTLQLATRQVLVQGNEIQLTPTEFDLLRLFVQYPDRIWSREAILAALNVEEESSVFQRTVDAHVKNLRNKLGEAQNHIRTVRGSGYRWQPASD
jgi:two-component system phosphate regulon response regulator PhoB